VCLCVWCSFALRAHIAVGCWYRVIGGLRFGRVFVRRVGVPVLATVFGVVIGDELCASSDDECVGVVCR
jgi:hypothetical protein